MYLDGPGAAPHGSSEAFRRLLERLLSLSRGGSKFGLERMQRLCERLDHPERALPMVHVAGSNGKGSTSAFLASALAVSGRRVGLFTSPHLVSLTERIQFLDPHPSPISAEALIRAAEVVERVEPGFGEASFFEVMTAIGLVAFRDAGVEVAVIEAGLGARLDSTRVIDAQVAVLTDLSLEHTAILGDTLEEIAREEGAVVRPGRPLVMADGPAAAMRVVEALAAEEQAELFRIGDRIDLTLHPDGRFDLMLDQMTLLRAELSLLGAHQGRNAVLAAQAACLIAPDLSEDALRAGLASAVWPGRMEVIERLGEPATLLDGAHNPQAARVFARALGGSARFAGPRHFVFGVLSDKKVTEMLDALAPRAASFTLTRPGSMRARDPEELEALLRESAGFTGPIDVTDNPTDALAKARARARKDRGWVIVCGSLYLVGDIRAELFGATDPAR